MLFIESKPFIFTSGMVVVLLTCTVVIGSPPRFSLFQGSAPSSSTPRHRSKNWCAYIVHKNVTCAVLTTSESPDLSPCPLHQPDCHQRMMHFELPRPMYRTGYKQVTEMEWRCCPDYQGHDCSELKGGKPKHGVFKEPRLHDVSSRKQQRPEVVAGIHSRSHLGQRGLPSPQTSDQYNAWAITGHREHGIHRVQALEEVVEQLSQTVLDLQAALTSTNANLRLQLQDDASKILLNMLGNVQQPQDAKKGATESFLVPANLHGPISEEVQSKLTHLSNTINTNSHSIQDLHVRIQNIDRQLHQVKDAPSSVPREISPTISECSCQAYIDEKLSALREELLEGMDIKISDMKNGCDYKVLALQEQCDEQEHSYSSLADLIDSKEADFRKEIQDLRLSLATSPALDDAEVQKMKDIQKTLAETIKQQNTTLVNVEAQGHVLEARLGLAEKSTEVHCLYLEEKLRSERLKEEEERNKVLLDHVQRLQILEKRTRSPQDGVDALGQEIKIMENSRSEFPGNPNQSLRQRLEKLEQNSAEGSKQMINTNALLGGLDSRVTNIESVCERFDSMSESLKRIKDGLNKHVNSLWTCVRKLNSTVLTNSRDIAIFKTISASSETQKGLNNPSHYSVVLEAPEDFSVPTDGSSALPSLSVLVSGEAGPPGNRQSEETLQGIHQMLMTNHRAASFPLFPASAPSSDSASGTAQLPLKAGHVTTERGHLMSRTSFSAGLSLVPFPGKVGIIRFNKVLLNDGRHYDAQTGVFTAPVDGRYLLTAVLTAQIGENVEAFLSVGSRSIQKLDTAWSGGGATEGCVCGGSTSVSLVLHLRRGERTGLVLTSGKLAISASSEILSSFSGVLLYPSEPER